MRWARLEVLGRDLQDSWACDMVGGTAGGGEWLDLCNLWSSGLWGLRLGIKGSITGSITGSSAIDKGWVEGGPLLEAEALKKISGGVLDVDAEWAVEGLGQMKALRWVEIEIEDMNIDRDLKVQFCVDLGKRLSTPERKIDVVSVEKVEEMKA